MKTILLVDDDPSLRTLLSITLRQPDFRILQASDGITALEIAQRERPDLLILDWMMPGMSGLGVAGRLKENPSTREIPIIMLTARAEDQDRVVALSLGICGFLVKPFSPLALLRQVETVLKKNEDT